MFNSFCVNIPELNIRKANEYFIFEYFQEISSRLLFPKVTEIELKCCNYWPASSLQSLSLIIDLSRIVVMKISGYNFHQYIQNIWMHISSFINQVHNLSSLIINSDLSICDSSRMIENIHSIIPHHIKCLQIPIDNLNQIKPILERCENLSTIIFDIEDVKFSNEIIQWFAENTINTTFQAIYRRVTVWLGRINIQLTEDNYNSKRIKLTDNCSDS